MPRYDPSKDINPYVRFVAGDYPAHITKVTTRMVNVQKGKYRAEVYNITSTINEAVSGTTFKTMDNKGVEKEVEGKHFIDKEIRHNGVFRFLDTLDIDEFESNEGGNGKYMKLCEAVGAELKEVKEGEHTLWEFPVIDESHLIGKPIIVTVGQGKKYLNKSNEWVYPMMGTDLCVWESGTPITDPDKEELPF
jgi:hypothetical protein